MGFTGVLDDEDRVSDDDLNYELGPGMVNVFGPFHWARQYAFLIAGSKKNPGALILPFAIASVRNIKAWGKN